MRFRELPDEQIDEIIRLIIAGANMNKIKKTFRIGEGTMYHALDKRNFDFAFLSLDYEKERRGKEHTRKVKVYWDKFSTGDYILLHKDMSYRGRYIKPVQLKAMITNKKSTYMQIQKLNSNRKITINFADIADKRYKIKLLDVADTVILPPEECKKNRVI